MSKKAIITSAGKYPVRQDPCPHFGPVADHAWKAPTGILHTTECPFKPAEDEFEHKWAPHFLLGLNYQKKIEIVQLVPIGFMGAAIRAHNDQALVQIEMVGESSEKSWTPDPQTLDALASLMLVCRDEWGIPLSHPWKDGDYPRYGDNPHRHTGDYGKTPGWFGHGDVPYPDEHWDPGNFAWSVAFAHAQSLAKPSLVS